MLSTLVFLSVSYRPRLSNGESVRDQLRRQYAAHNVVSYANTRKIMYNQADCTDGKMTLLYSGTTFPWKCGGSQLPSAAYVNAEHIVPQSSFGKQQPMVSDLHHLYSAASVINNARSNYKFVEMSLDKCTKYCRDLACQTSKPSNPIQYSCLGPNGNTWMPLASDKGKVARAIFYFYTMYPDYDISTVGDVATFKRWNIQYPPTSDEKMRNTILNQTQGNRNPYIDDYKLVDKAF